MDRVAISCALGSCTVLPCSTRPVLNRYTTPLLMVAALLAAVVIVRTFFGKSLPFMDSPKTIPLSQFIEDVQSKNIVQGGEFTKDRFEGKYFENAPGATGGNRKFSVVVPPEN